MLKVTSLSDLEPEISSALAYRPVLVHVGFGIGDGVATYTDLDWDWFNAQLQRAGSHRYAPRGLNSQLAQNNRPALSEP